METLEFYETASLPAECGQGFGGITFDGCFYYLVKSETCEIYQFDRDFKEFKSYSTGKRYAGICFDYSEKCFWAYDKDSYNRIYKLNNCFEETDSIEFENVYTPIKGISYNCGKNSLLIAYNDRVIEISKAGTRLCLYLKGRLGYYTGILSISPYHAVIWRDKYKQEIRFYNTKGNLVSSYCVPFKKKIKAAMFYPLRSHDLPVTQITFLIEKECGELRVWHCKLTDRDIRLCCCNYWDDYLKLCECNTFHPKDKMSPYSLSGLYSSYGNTDKKIQNIWELVESAAHVGASLAYILNTEGEKLEKAIEIAVDINDLLLINRSVNRTLTNAANLEAAMFAKLEALLDFCETEAE